MGSLFSGPLPSRPARVFRRAAGHFLLRRPAVLRQGVEVEDHGQVEDAVLGPLPELGPPVPAAPPLDPKPFVAHTLIIPPGSIAAVSSASHYSRTSAFVSAIPSFPAMQK